MSAYDRVREATEYVALCREAQALGIDTSLDTNPALDTVDALRAAISDARVADAERRGVEDGTAAGSWVVDGKTSEESARALLAGIEDCDPAVMDALPDAPLSGEWADGLLPRDVLGWYGLTEDDDSADDILSAYEDGYSRGVMDETVRSARAMLPDSVQS